MSGMEIFSSLLGLCLAVECYLRRSARSKWIFPPFTFAFLIFIAAALLGIIAGPAKLSQKFYDFGRMRLFLLYAIAFYELVFFSPSRRWLIPLVVSCCVVGVFGILQHFVPNDFLYFGTGRIIVYAIPEQHIGSLVVGFFNHHLTFSNVFSFYACLFTALGFSGDPKRRWYLALGLFLLLLLFWTQSRAAWMAIPVMVLVIAFGKSVKWAGACFVFGIAVMGVLYFTDPGFHARFERTFFKQDDFYNLGPRRRLWHAQISMFKEHPILGFGYNNNERFCKEYMLRLYPDNPEPFCGHAHSTFLQILATTGIVGSVAFIWLWWVIFRYSFRVVRSYSSEQNERWIALGCLAAFIGFQIQGSTQWNFGDAKVLHNLMFFLAVISALGFKKGIKPSGAS